MLMNVQLYSLGDRGVKLCARCLNCRNTGMFNTCTSMTWTHSTTYTQRLNKWHILHTNKLIWICIFNHPFILYSLFSFLLSFILDIVISVWSAHQCFGEALKLHQTIRETFTGRLLVNIRPVSAWPQITPEEWTVWLCSMMTEVSL